jgi:hypothetical protein
VTQKAESAPAPTTLKHEATGFALIQDMMHTLDSQLDTAVEREYSLAQTAERTKRAREMVSASFGAVQEQDAKPLEGGNGGGIAVGSAMSLVSERAAASAKDKSEALRNTQQTPAPQQLEGSSSKAENAEEEAADELSHRMMRLQDARARLEEAADEAKVRVSLLWAPPARLVRVLPHLDRVVCFDL